MAQQFASSVQSGSVNGFSISSILASLGITTGSGDSGTLLGLSTDSSDSSSLAQSLGLSDAELAVGAIAGRLRSTRR